MFWNIAKSIFYNNSDIDTKLLEESILDGKNLQFYKYKKSLKEYSPKFDNVHTRYIKDSSPIESLAYTIAMLKCIRLNDVDVTYYKNASRSKDTLDILVGKYMKHIGVLKPLFSDKSIIPFDKYGLDLEEGLKDNSYVEDFQLSIIAALNFRIKKVDFDEVLTHYSITRNSILEITDCRYGFNNMVVTTSSSARQSTIRHKKDNESNGVLYYITLLEISFLSEVYNGKYNYSSLNLEKTITSFNTFKSRLEKGENVEAVIGRRFNYLMVLFTIDNNVNFNYKYPMFAKFFTFVNRVNVSSKKVSEHSDSSKYSEHWNKCLEICGNYNYSYGMSDLLECFISNAMPSDIRSANKKELARDILLDVVKFVEPFIMDKSFLKSNKLPMIFQTHSPLRPNSNKFVGSEVLNGTIYMDLDLKYAECLNPLIDGKTINEQSKIKKDFAKGILLRLHERLSTSYCEPYLLSKLSMSRMGIHVIFKYLQPYGDFLDGNKSLLPKYNNIDGDGLRILQDLAYVKTFLMVKKSLSEIVLEDFYGTDISMSYDSLGDIVKRGGGDSVMDGSMRKIEQGIALCNTPLTFKNPNFKFMYSLSAINLCYITDESVKNWGVINKRFKSNINTIKENLDTYKAIITGSATLKHLVKTKDGYKRMSDSEIDQRVNSGQKVVTRINRTSIDYDSTTFDNIGLDFLSIDVNDLKGVDYNNKSYWGAKDFRYHMKRIKVGSSLKSIIHSQYGISCDADSITADLEILDNRGHDSLNVYTKIKDKYIEVMAKLCYVSDRKSKFNSNEWESHMFYGGENPWNTCKLVNSSLDRSAIDMFKECGMVFFKKENDITIHGLPNIKDSFYYPIRQIHTNKILNVANTIVDLLGNTKDKVKSDSDFKYLSYSDAIKKLYDYNPKDMDVIINPSDVGGGYYMSEYSIALEQFFDNRCFNFINARAGAGKTTYFTDLAVKKNKRVLLVMPYTAPMDSKFGDGAVNREVSKIINDTTIGNEKKQDDIASIKAFKPFSGSKKNKEMYESLEVGISSVITFDKFARLDVETLLNYDYIAIDEIHVMATETIRSVDADSVCPKALKLIRELLLYKKENEYDEVPFIIGMTGTPTYTIPLIRMSELDVTNKSEKMSVRNIKMHIPHNSKKTLNVVLCNTARDSKANLCKQIATSIMNNKSVICPTDEGSFKAEDIVEGINQHLRENGFEPINYDEWHYYKRATKDTEVSSKINDESYIPKGLKLLFCSVYLSVGVDIKNISDKMEIDIITNFSKYTAQSLEQFGNRLRKQNINVTIIKELFRVTVDKNNNECFQLKNDFNNSLDYNFLLKIHKAIDGEMSNRIQDDQCVAYFNHYVSVNDDKISESKKVSLWSDLNKRFSFSYEDFTGEIKVVQDNLMILRYVAENNYSKNGSNIRYITNMFRKHYDYDSVTAEYTNEELLTIIDAMTESRAENDEEKRETSIQVSQSLLGFISENKGKDIENFMIGSKVETIDSDENQIDFDEDEKVITLSFSEKHHKRLKLIMNKLIPIAKQYSYNAENFEVLINMCLNRGGNSIVISEIERFSKLIEFKKLDIYDNYLTIIQRLERLALAKKGTRMSEYVEKIEHGRDDVKNEIINQIEDSINSDSSLSSISTIDMVNAKRKDMIESYDTLSNIEYTLSTELFEKLKDDVYVLANTVLMNNTIKGLTTKADYSVNKLIEKVDENIKTFFRIQTNPHSGTRTLRLRILPDDFRNILDSVVKTNGNEEMKVSEFEKYLI